MFQLKVVISLTGHKSFIVCVKMALMLPLASASDKSICQAMICRIRIQTWTVVSYYNCTALD